MFSGIVEEVGVVQTITELDGAREFLIGARAVLTDLAPGASVSIDGACHTAVSVIEDGFTVQSIGTTLSRTVAAFYAPGTSVNLERSMALGGRLDGHLVQGHVDGLGELISLAEEGEYRLLDFRLPKGIAARTILHGSITINGVSLTVNALPGSDICQVGIIPFTWEHTNLGKLVVGDAVNVEGDMIGKYVRRMLPEAD
jgi:riboflavin synthase